MSRNRKSPPRAGAREQAAIFRQALLLAFLAALAAAVLPLRAQEPGPEIQRPPGCAAWPRPPSAGRGPGTWTRRWPGLRPGAAGFSTT